MANDTGHALDWDATIENDGEGFTLFPHGTECTFEVIELEKTRTKDGGKLPNCPMAKIKLKCTHPELGTTTVNESLVLHSSMEWKLCQFFVCIGQRKHGEPLRPKWPAGVGSKGRVKLQVDKYTTTNNQGNREERESNKVDKWLDSAATGGNQVPAAAQKYTISDDDF